MNTSAIKFRTQKRIKEQANKIVQNLGFSLEEILNAYLKQIIRTKAVYFSLQKEEPSEYLIRAIEKADQENKNGEYHSFDNVDDFIKSLNQ
jgi:addiction module RelB/DinJ family antitoxin